MKRSQEIYQFLEKNNEIDLQAMKQHGKLNKQFEVQCDALFLNPHKFLYKDDNEQNQVAYLCHSFIGEFYNNSNVICILSDVNFDFLKKKLRDYKTIEMLINKLPRYTTPDYSIELSLILLHRVIDVGVLIGRIKGELVKYFNRINQCEELSIFNIFTYEKLQQIINSSETNKEILNDIIKTQLIKPMKEAQDVFLNKCNKLQSENTKYNQNTCDIMNLCWRYIMCCGTLCDRLQNNSKLIEDTHEECMIIAKQIQSTDLFKDHFLVDKQIMDYSQCN
jgi:hypothetical protein